MRKLYWFRNDLRIQDNPGLLAQQDADGLLLVYCWPKTHPWFNAHGMGGQRQRFLLESLQSLREDLAKLGQNLMVLHGSPELLIPDLVREYSIDQVASSRAPGYYERKTAQFLRERLTVPYVEHENTTLFTRSTLPFDVSSTPKHFTPFRNLLEDTLHTAPVSSPGSLPRPPSAPFNAIPPAETQAHTAFPVRGGSAHGHRRLQRFIFEDQSIARYKETRDCLDALSGSSTLSPWISNGCISPREIATAITRYEQLHGANESTYWLYFELLWREFFHWQAYKSDSALFKQGARRTTLHQCTFEPRSFARWSAGDTDYPLVNAVIRQLLATGWASNRGRQIAASCLVNELRLDWRYGAAFFEKHLIDYDVASNYGNWRYIAGVGADPRGGRHMNIEKQTQEHDPEGTFIEKWGGHRPTQPDFVTDAADWPIKEC